MKGLSAGHCLLIALGLSALVCGSLLVRGSLNGTGPPPVQAFDASKVDGPVQEAMKTWHVPGLGIAIVRGDEVVYLKGFGVKELGGKKAVTPDTLFPLGSCTKAFTTTAMAMLVDEGKMAWDDPVRKHLDYFRLADPLADANVTLRDLVCHRTGLGSNDLLWYQSPWSPEESVRRIGHVKLSRSFRSGFQYQTTMFTAAGLAVARASGKTWADFVQERILNPQGMTGARFTTQAAEKAGDFASGHRRDRQGKIEVIPRYRMDVPEPAGSLHANARDLARWVVFQLGDGTFERKRLVSAKNLGETHVPQTIIRLEGVARDMNPETNLMNYGMAWVLQDYQGQLLVSHAGAIDGFRAHLTLVPKAKVGIALVNNLDRTDLNIALSNTLVDLLLGLPPRDWNAYYQEQVQKQQAALVARLKERAAKRQRGTKPSHELAAYVGAYEDPAYGTVTVSLENGALQLKWNNFSGDLEHFHFDTFSADIGPLGFPQVLFSLDRDGEIASLKVLDVMEGEFKKLKAGGR